MQDPSPTEGRVSSSCLNGKPRRGDRSLLFGDVEARSPRELEEAVPGGDVRRHPGNPRMRQENHLSFYTNLAILSDNEIDPFLMTTTIILERTKYLGINLTRNMQKQY